jgi:CMP-N-acetylneuraminic acid synthetase
MFVWNLKKCLDVLGGCYVSSDSDKILDIARKNGAKTIKRPLALCGNTPNIEVYRHAIKEMSCDAFVAVQACSPTINVNLIEWAKDLILGGYPEVMTCYPLTRLKDTRSYHRQYFPIYGSIWAMVKERLGQYENPYRPNPEVLLVDDSIDIHNINDFNKAQKLWSLMLRS